ncbi:MAG: V-type ATP synthase subunit K [Candidatus Wallbacteria bacterium]|nr:V-type ATP synthase subunit K [Candidatus Wallbacteria bacterium]
MTELLLLPGLGFFLALAGAAFAAGLAGMGSSHGVGIAGQASDAIVAEEPEKFVKCLVLQALPGTQGIYGFLAAVLVLFKLQAFGANPITTLTVMTGFQILVSCIPVGLVCYYSGVWQGRVAASAMAIVARNEQDFTKGIIFSAMVETYAIIGLITTILMLTGIKVS